MRTPPRAVRPAGPAALGGPGGLAGPGDSGVFGGGGGPRDLRSMQQTLGNEATTRETPLAAARRELAEETGLDPAAVLDESVPGRP